MAQLKKGSTVDGKLIATVDDVGKSGGNFGKKELLKMLVELTDYFTMTPFHEFSATYFKINVPSWFPETLFDNGWIKSIVLYKKSKTVHPTLVSTTTPAQLKYDDKSLKNFSELTNNFFVLVHYDQLILLQKNDKFIETQEINFGGYITPLGDVRLYLNKELILSKIDEM